MQYQHKVVRTAQQDAEEVLNELGDKGWRLVSAIHAGLNTLIAYMVRENP